MLKKNELIQVDSCFNRAKMHERIFVLLERDEAAPLAIRVWAQYRITSGKNKPDDDQILEALACADGMDKRFTCPKCEWTGPYIKACEDPNEPPRCPVCG